MAILRSHACTFLVQTRCRFESLQLLTFSNGLLFSTSGFCSERAPASFNKFENLLFANLADA
jgi:hypothetical protein